ncbi:MAG: tetratricopeptide repeat protein [Nitrospira sp.]|nr:tetratricopeptide repeat protein [Nitrospira sp.]
MARVVRALSTGLGISGLCVVLAACQAGKQVLVEVMYPPKAPIPAKVKEIEVEEFQGPMECAKPFKPKLITKVTEGGIYTIAIKGLSDPEETLTIKGTVATCALNQGSGTLNTEFSGWYMGNQVHQAVVAENTTRPGAPPNEVRDVLINRVRDRMAKDLLPTKRKEIRTFLPVDGDNDSGMTAASGGNWKLAIEAFGKQLKEKPADHRAWYNRGVAYEASAQFELAVKDLQKAIELKRRELYVEELARVDKELQHQKSIQNLGKNSE